MSSGRPIHPILTCAEAAAWEKHVLGADPEAAWAAMVKASAGVGAAVLRDFVQWRPLPRDPKVLVLAGPGHNGGDALLATREILRARPRGKISVVLLEPVEKFKPLAKRAWDELAQCSGVELLTLKQIQTNALAGNCMEWDITLDGLYGMGFHPPLSESARELIEQMNNIPGAIGFRAAVDVPSGVGDQTGDVAFIADFTYATGIAKTPLFNPANAKWVGRIRYIDLGFFEKGYEGSEEKYRRIPEHILLPNKLAGLARLRDPLADKRAYGHLLVVSGSRMYPGAQMLNVLGALRAGAGLVTALTPMSHAAAFAAARPEAMWRGCPEDSGSHGLATLDAVRELLPRISAILAGSGMGRSKNTQAMLKILVEVCPLPIVLDADALMPEILEAVLDRPAQAGPIIITPHAGEFARLASEGADLMAFSQKYRVVTVLKGPVTRICDGKNIYCSTFGGPVLARGGSGDILAGMVGALLAQTPREAIGAASLAVVWHGLAADALARARGETSALTSELASYLPEALRNEWGH